MSYSFSVKAKTKEECMTALAEKFVDVIKTQPAHESDKAAALNAADAFMSLLKPVPDDHHIEISLHGSLGWEGSAPNLYIGAGVGVSCRVEKDAEPKAGPVEAAQG